MSVCVEEGSRRSEGVVKSLAFECDYYYDYYDGDDDDDDGDDYLDHARQCLLLVTLTSGVHGLSVEWQEVEGELQTISVGRAGVWGIGSKKKVLYLQNSFRNYSGTFDQARWKRVRGE